MKVEASTAIVGAMLTCSGFRTCHWSWSVSSFARNDMELFQEKSELAQWHDEQTTLETKLIGRGADDQRLNPLRAENQHGVVDMLRYYDYLLPAKSDSALAWFTKPYIIVSETSPVFNFDKTRFEFGTRIHSNNLHVYSYLLIIIEYFIVFFCYNCKRINSVGVQRCCSWYCNSRSNCSCFCCYSWCCTAGNRHIASLTCSKTDKKRDR